MSDTAYKTFPDKSPVMLDWNHVLLTGWYDRHGKAYFVPQQLNGPTVRVVLTGIEESEIPLLDIALPPGVKLEAVPENENPFEYARAKGGIYAIGVYIRAGFERLSSGALLR